MKDRIHNDHAEEVHTGTRSGDGTAGSTCSGVNDEATVHGNASLELSLDGLHGDMRAGSEHRSARRINTDRKSPLRSLRLHGTPRRTTQYR